jgi:hypothetical protein
LVDGGPVFKEIRVVENVGKTMRLQDEGFNQERSQILTKLNTGYWVSILNSKLNLLQKN